MLRRVLPLLLLLTISTPALAFNGSRKGFVLGTGLGGAVVTSPYQYSVRFYDFSSTGTDSVYVVHAKAVSGRETRAAVATDFTFGWGITDRVVMAYSNSVTWGYESGITAVAVSYYISPVAPSSLMEAGVGLTSGRSLGIWLGAGYEFRSHWLVRGRLGISSPGSGWRSATLGVTLNWLGY